MALAISLDKTDISCQGAADGRIGWSLSGGTEPYTINWSNTVLINENNLEAGKYIVTITDANNCQIIDSTDILEPTILDATIVVQQALLCHNDNNGELALQIQGGTAPYAFLWEDGSMADTRNNLITGNYSATITDSNQCSFEQSITLTEPGELGFDFEITTISCTNAADGQLTIHANEGLSPYEYLVNNVSYTDSQFINLSPGNYSLQVRDANNCTTPVIDTTITEPDPLAISLTGKDVDCMGANNGQIDFSVTGGTLPYIVDWSETVTNNSPDLSPNWYIVTLTDANNCSLIDSIEITEPLELTGSIQLNQPLLCFGGNEGAIEVIAMGGTLPYTYLWEDGTTNATHTSLVANDYSVTITDGNNCVFETTISLDQPDSLEFMTMTTDVVCFNENNGTITFTSNGGVPPYTYFINNVQQDSFTITGLIANDYRVQIRDANNCESAIENITIGTPEILTAEASTTPVICAGTATGTASIEVKGGIANYEYSWSNGGMDSLNNTLLNGNYTVSILDENNCEAEVSFFIDTPGPVESIFELVHNLCYDDEKGAIILNRSSGGSGVYNYYLDDMLAVGNDTLFSQLPSDSYDLRTVDDNGCEKIDKIGIEQPAEMVADLGEDIEIVFGEANQLHLDIIQPGPNVEITWLPTDFLNCGDTTDLPTCHDPQIVLPLNSVEYEVLVTDEHGCTAMDDIYVQVVRQDNPVYLGNAFSPNADGVNDVFYVQAHPSVGRIIKFQILNRWGAIFYQSDNFVPNDTAFGWDGYFKGELSNTGVYIYMVEYEVQDGKREIIMGDVLLVK